ncbi:hypothetical protein [Frigidibacter sp. SD6-1]|uniref:hypothetical protein n=1 Tax=Frigidibacter sp. SD6-1 TaxID=3032581 RepID=UPI0024DF6FB7|nr:hypothetical protein [Frigidibacter sp. SD6-1]
MRISTYALLAGLAGALPASAETVLSEVTGNWAAPANDGFYYRALLTHEGDYLRLRIFEGMSADALPAEPTFDSPRIAYASTLPEARDWLEVGPEGQLFLNSVAVNESHVYSERLWVHHMDNQVTVMGYETYNNGPDAVASMPANPFTCWGTHCYSCVADVWDGTSAIGDEPYAHISAPVEAINAATWTPETIYELGLCPAPD